MKFPTHDGHKTEKTKRIQISLDEGGVVHVEDFVKDVKHGNTMSVDVL